MVQDLRYSVQRLLRNPAFTLVALISLAVGIAINASVFSMVNMILLRPLPVADADRLVRIYSVNASGFRFGASSYPDYEDFRDGSKALQTLAAERFVQLSLSRNGQPELLWGQLVSGNYFQLLGVRAHLGRTLMPEDDRHPGAHPVVVLGYSLWQRNFGADAGIVDRGVLLNGRRYTVVGILPKGFVGAFVGARAEAWVPMMMQNHVMPVGERLEQRGARWLTLTGRLAPGVSIGQTVSELRTLAERLAADHPTTNEDRSVHLVPFEQDTMPFQAQAQAGGASVFMLAITVAVLLIGCVNLATILLAQATFRQVELAARQALGASRGRLLRQFVTETLVLALLAAAVALPLAAQIQRWIGGARLPGSLPAALDLRLDWRVLAFTLLVALAVGVFLGLVPALRATRFDLTAALKGGGIAGAGAGRLRLRSALVSFQIGASLILLVISGLFLRSLRNTLAVEPGFDAGKVMVSAVHLGLQDYDEARGRVWYRQLLERTAVLPGVEAVALAELVPLAIGANQQVGVELEGQEEPGGERLVVDYNLISPGYFAAMGIPLLRGRDFTDAEERAEVSSVIVNQTMAQRFWPGVEAVGQRLTVAGQPARVVGTVRDSKYRGLDESPRPFLYLSFPQHYEPAMALHLRSSGNPSQLLEPVRREIRTLDQNLPVSETKTLQESVRHSAMPAQLAAAFTGFLSLLALALAALGSYGIMVVFVAQRRREMGIRLALGARPSDLLKQVMRQSTTRVAIGAGVGLVLSLVVAHFLSSMLYGVAGVDVGVLLLALLVLLAVAAASTFVPARRASRVEPSTTLRYE